MPFPYTFPFIFDGCDKTSSETGAATENLGIGPSAADSDVRADDTARALGLEDGSAVINAKLGTVEATWTVEEGVERPMYSAVFYETS